MKRFMFLFMSALFFAVSVPVMAQGVELIPPEINSFLGLGTFAALAAAIPVVVELIKRFIPKMSSLANQILSWTIGIVVTMVCWFFNFGFPAGLVWWVALLYGAGVSLAANGVFDIGFISKIFDGIFGKKAD